MKRKSRKARVLRITVDEKLSDDLFRFVFCPLREGIEKFTDIDDEWQEEREKLVHPQNYARIFGVKKSEAPAWETLTEGQVYLSGEFEVIGDQANPEYFKTSIGQRKLLRVDTLDIIDERVKSVYSDVLRGT
jgi:hypothetical protein